VVALSSFAEAAVAGEIPALLGAEAAEPPSVGGSPATRELQTVLSKPSGDPTGQPATSSPNIKFDNEETPVCERELELFGREDTAKDMMEPEDDAEEDDGRSGEDDIDDQLQALGDDIGSLVQSQSQLSGEDGNTPLMIAASNRKLSSVKKNLAKGDKVNAQNNDGDTALLLAIKFSGGTQNVIQELLATEGVDVNIKNNNHDTALMLASKPGYTNTVGALLAKGAKVNAQDKVGTTALMYAALGGWDYIVKGLLSYSADTDIINSNGRTALSSSMRCKTTTRTALELLLEAKLDSIEKRVNQLENVGD